MVSIPKFSIIIVTKDITKDILPTLEQTLALLSPFNDIWIIHSGEDNGIKHLSKKHNANFMPYTWNGEYPKKRQYCLENVPTQSDWIFFLDADETMSPTLQQEIEKTLTNPSDNTAGYFVKSSYVWNGHSLKYGLKNNKIVLINKKRMKYPVINDLKTKIGEIEGHYQPIPSGLTYKIEKLISKTQHFAYVDQKHWGKRHEIYAQWEAFMIKQNTYPRDPSFLRETCKRTFRKMPFRAHIAFLHSYIYKLGILDGKAGLQFAKTRHHYYTMVAKKLRTLQ